MTMTHVPDAPDAPSGGDPIRPLAVGDSPLSLDEVRAAVGDEEWVGAC